MEPEQTLLALTEFALSIMLALLFLRWRGKDTVKFRVYFLLMSLAYFAAGSAEVVLAADGPLRAAFHSVQILFSAILFSLFAADASGSKKLKAFSLAITATIFLIPNSGDFTKAAYLVSIAIGFVSNFLIFEYSPGRIRYAGLFGLLATGAGAAILFLGVPGVTFETFWFVPNIFFAASFAALLGFGPENSLFLLPRKIELLSDRNASFSGTARPLFSLIVYLSLLNVFLMLGALSLHEAGHFLAGAEMSCRGEAVLFDSERGPHTQLSCPPGVSENMLALSGFIFVIPFAAAFFLLRRYPERNFGLVIFGLALVMGSIDLSAAIASNAAVYALMLAGVLLICLGEALLINSYVSPKK